MDDQQQIDIGYSQIRAAVRGPHDIMDAWLEVFNDFGGEEKIGVLAGASACLMACVAILESAGCLQSAEEPYAIAFLDLGNEGRNARIMAALGASDLDQLNRLAFIMARCITPYKGQISFNGYMPTVAPLV